MKKRIALISLAGLLCAGAVYAAVQGQDQAEADFPAVQQEETGEAVISQGTEEEAITIQPFEPSQTDEIYLGQLIDDGYRADWLEEIYEFWLTCGEDISIIEDIYHASEEQNFTGRYWVEESYNYVTNYAHGVLDVAQVGDYLAKSITRDQIRQANILSRQGVYTINEILDQLLAGKTWSELVNEVYGAGTVPANAVYLDMEGISKIKKQTGTSPIVSVISDYYEFEEVPAAQDVYGESQVIRSVYGDGAGTIVCVPKKELGKVQLEQTKVSTTRKKKTIDDAKKAGVSQEELEILGQEYSAEKICLAQEVAEKYDKTATQVLEEYEQNGAWSKLLKEAE